MTRSRYAVAAVLLAGALAVATPASAIASTAAEAAGSGPVSVAVVVPLTVPPTTSGLLDAETLATYTRDGGLLDRQLDAVAGTRAAIGLDPMIPASIRVLGSGAPDSALSFLARLRMVSNEIFLLGYADADPALAAAAGIGDDFTPLGFGFTLDPDAFGPAATPAPTSSATPSTPEPVPTDVPGEKPPLPDTAALLAWPTTLPAIAWPAEGSVTKDGLAGLPALGYEDVLLSEGNTSTVSTAHVDLGDIDGLVVDDEVSSAVRDAVYAQTDAGYASAAGALEAELREAQRTAPGRTLIATLDRRWPFGTTRLNSVLGTIAAQSASTLVSLSDVLATTAASAKLAPADDDADAKRTATLTQLASAASDEARYLRIAEDAGVITQPRRLALLGLSAVGWRVDAAGWATATASEIAAARKTLDAVQLAESSDQLVLSDVSSLRLRLSNALPVAVTVYVDVRPLRPLLHVDDRRVEVTIEPDSTANATIPVTSITNGEVTVRARLLSSTGDTLGAPRFLNVILQAGWETAGTLIVGALVVLVFGAGIVRAFLRRRRERAGAGG
ncbi:MAG TPA: DUF6049 family protein [Pseudolysinimonas sp.]|nr:DUF6049 family protein [Pseudolysinimonas sp.]